MIDSVQLAPSLTLHERAAGLRTVGAYQGALQIHLEFGSVSIFVHETRMEAFECYNHVCQVLLRWEDGGSNMESAWFLSEPGTWHH